MNANALPYDVAIFDLDGTLMESEPGIVNCVQYALQKFGIRDKTREELRPFVGPPLMDSFQGMIGLSAEDAERAIEYYRERYYVTGHLENEVYALVPALLRTLKARGVYLAIASSKPHPIIDTVLDAFDLRRYFDAVCAPSGEGGDHSKEMLVKMALPEGCRRACMVGDRLFDINGGRKNGIDAIGAAYGYGGREELEGAGATIIVESVAELTSLLLGGGDVLPGKFISLEGSDGCGKSTQHALLAKWLKAIGHDPVVTREPGGCPISERIRSIVLDAKEMGMSDECEALLFAASRAQHVHEVIRPSLRQGRAVLCDRFVDSSIAYQGIGRGMGADLIKAINAPALAGVMPDVTLLLDIDPDCAMGRRVAAESPDRIEKTRGDFVRRVYEGYRQLAKEEPGRYRVIDANGSAQEVFERIQYALLNVL